MGVMVSVTLLCVVVMGSTAAQRRADRRLQRWSSCPDRFAARFARSRRVRRYIAAAAQREQGLPAVLTAALQATETHRNVTNALLRDSAAPRSITRARSLLVATTVNPETADRIADTLTADACPEVRLYARNYLASQQVVSHG